MTFWDSALELCAEKISPYYTGTGHIRVGLVVPYDHDYYRYRIRLYLSHATGTVWFDGVELQLGGQSNFNSVENCGFWNSSRWTAQFPQGIGTYTRTSTDPWQSTYAKLSSTSANCEAWLSQEVNVNDRTPFTVAGMVKTSAADEAKLVVQFYDATGSPLGDPFQTRGLNGDFDWLLLACRATPPAGSAKALWSLVFKGPTGSYACLDNAELIEVTTTCLEWDAGGDYRTASTDPCDNRTEFAFDVLGNRLSVDDAEAHATGYTYDAMNRALTATDALGYTTYSRYDACGNLISWRDARTADPEDFAYETTFDYDPRGQVTRTTDPLGRSVTRAYDLAGNIVSESYPNGAQVAYTYDAAGRVATKTYSPENRVLSYSYDGCGNVTAVTETKGGVERAYALTYDGAGRLLSRTGPAGEGTVTEMLDRAGNVLRIEGELGVWSYTYNAYNKPLTAKVDANSVSYYYDDRGRVHSAAGGEYGTSYALRRTYEYLPNGWLKRMVDGIALPGQEFLYEYDGDGNIVVADEAGVRDEYAYGAKHQLVLWRDNAGVEHSYAYDPAGNIINMDGVAYAYDEASQITNPGFVCDANGNMLSDGAKTYEYDGENRLARVSYDWSYWYPDRPDLGSPYDPPVYSLVEIAPPVPAEPILVHETVTAEYRYNYQGLRTRKTVTRVNDYLGTSVEETFFIYDLSGNLIEERFGPNEADWIRRYVWGPGGRLAMVENRDGSYDVDRTNLRGDVVSWVTASTGAPETDRFEYDPWGNILSGPSFAPPIRYASYYYDEESGLYYVKARYYSPKQGRFLTRDPAAASDSYAYAAGKPIRVPHPVVWRQVCSLGL